MSLDKPKISVMMPVHNMADTIKDAVESVLKNGFGDFELIIFDDGCDDNSVETLGDDILLDRRVRVIQGGVWGEHGGKARQECLDVARGEYVCNFDADDVMLPGALQRQVEFLDTNPEFAMTHCPVLLCDGDMKSKGIFEMGVPGYIAKRHERWDMSSDNRLFPDVSNQVPTDLFEMEWEYSFMQTSACLMRRSFIQEHNLGFDCNLPYRGSMQDYDLCLSILALGKVKWMNQVTTKVRKRPMLSDEKWSLPGVPPGPANDRNRSYIQEKHRCSLRRNTRAIPYFNSENIVVLSFQDDEQFPVFWPGGVTCEERSRFGDKSVDVVYSSYYVNDGSNYVSVRSHLMDCYGALRIDGLLKLIVPKGMNWVKVACEELGFGVGEEQETDFLGESYELFAVKRSPRLIRKISVLMPVYNAVNTVDRAIKSVLSQQLPTGWEVELCAVDDGSTDGTRELLHDYGDAHIKSVFLDKNLGHIAATRNVCLRHSTGDYVVTLDADDEMLPDALTQQILFLESYQGQDFGFCHTPCEVEEFVNDGKLLKRYYLLSIPADVAEGVCWKSMNGVLEPNVAEQVPQDLFMANFDYSFINNWGCMIRRSLVAMVRGYDETLPHNGAGEDYDLNLAISSRARGRWINQLSIVFHKSVDLSDKKWNKDASGNKLSGFFNYDWIRNKWRSEYQERLRSVVPVIHEAHSVEKLAIDIGAGDKLVVIPGHKVHRLDARQSTGADFVCSADDLSIIKDETYDYVLSSHVLEHFERPMAPGCLREWVRILKVGGTLRLLVPDFALFAGRVISGNYNEHDEWCRIYGAHTNDYDAHHAFFTEKTLRSLCEQQGLEILSCGSIPENCGSIEIIAIKRGGVLNEEKSCLSARLDKSVYCPSDSKISIYTEWDMKFVGAELWFRFADDAGAHHFSWVCSLSASTYTTSLHLTPDILNVEGLWRVSVFCNGLLVQTVPFEITSKTLVDQLYEEYISEKPCQS